MITHAFAKPSQPNRVTGWRNLPNPIPSHNGLSFLSLKRWVWGPCDGPGLTIGRDQCPLEIVFSVVSMRILSVLGTKWASPVRPTIKARNHRKIATSSIKCSGALAPTSGKRRLAHHVDSCRDSLHPTRLTTSCGGLAMTALRALELAVFGRSARVLR